MSNPDVADSGSLINKNKDDTMTQKFNHSKYNKTIKISCTPQHNRMHNTKDYPKPSTQTTAAGSRQANPGK